MGHPPARQEQQRTPNEQISLDQKVLEIIRRIGAAEREISEVLPRNITFDRFQAVIATALRHNPELLECHLPSIINAAIEAAWDQLLPDGKEGAFVAHNVKYQTKPDRYRKEAVWFPMVAGLRKKIMQSGLVSDLKTKVVYANEHFDWEEGLAQRLEHKPILGHAARGAPIAAYSIAWLRDGTVTFEVMDRDDILKVKAEAKTDFVWKKWEGEMWRKTVLRRHRKSLPQGRDIIDVEARVMFPQFSTEPAIPLVDENLRAPPKPTRQQFLSHDQSPRVDDFTGGWGNQGEPVAEERSRDRGDQQEGQQRHSPPPPPPPPPPASSQAPAEWPDWLTAFKSKLKTRTSTAALRRLEESEKRNLEEAPDKIGSDARQALDERYEALRLEGQ